MASYKPINLREMFLTHQTQMLSELDRFRSVIEHPGTKGDGTEDCWRQLLRKYLPKRYCVEGAQVIDCDGNVSDAIDVVIFDQQYTPFLFHQAGIYFIPAESVYAVFEVKQEITAEYVIYAGTKAESVRRLRRTSASIPYAGGTYSAKPLHHIPAGILTLDSSWKDGLGQPFAKSIESLPSSQRLDLGCVLRAASFQCSYEKQRVEIKKSLHEDALITFFLRLTAELQKIGTVPAIDFECWEKPLSLEWAPLQWEAADSATPTTGSHNPKSRKEVIV